MKIKADKLTNLHVTELVLRADPHGLKLSVKGIIKGDTPAEPQAFILVEQDAWAPHVYAQCRSFIDLLEDAVSETLGSQEPGDHAQERQQVLPGLDIASAFQEELPEDKIPEQF